MPSETADPAPAPPLVLQIPLLAAIYVVAGKLGLRLALVNESATAVWPPTGIALAALLLFGLRLWPGVFVGALAVNLWTSGQWASSLGIAAGNTLEAVAGCFLVERFAGGRRAFDHPRDVFRFAFLAAMASTALSATVGVTSLAATKAAAWSDFGTIWLTWWLGDLGGDLIVAPLLLLAASPGAEGGGRNRLLEGLLLAGAVAAVGGFVLGKWAPAASMDYPLGFLCLPVVLWAAFRFGTRGVSLAMAGLAALALWGALQHFGTISIRERNRTLVLLQAFLGVTSLTGLAVAAAVSERRRASGDLARRLEEVARLNAELDARKAEISTYHGLLTHDVSNVAAALLGLVERLLLKADGELTSSQEELLRRCNRQALEVRRMAENARILLRVREQGLPAPGEPVFVREALRRAVDQVRDLHFDRPFTVALDGLAELKVAATPLLENMLFNLLDNAVRHTPRGTPPSLRVNARAEAGRLAIEIQGGAPPPADLQARLFEPVRDGLRAAGHGMGLSLVREIVQRAGGSIEVRAVAGEGGPIFAVHLSLPSA